MGKPFKLKVEKDPVFGKHPSDKAGKAAQKAAFAQLFNDLNASLESNYTGAIQKKQGALKALTGGFQAGKQASAKGTAAAKQSIATNNAAGAQALAGNPLAAGLSAGVAGGSQMQYGQVDSALAEILSGLQRQQGLATASGRANAATVYKNKTAQRTYLGNLQAQFLFKKKKKNPYITPVLSIIGGYFGGSAGASAGAAVGNAVTTEGF